MATSILGNPLPAITILCAVIAAALLVHYIIKRPPLNTQTKLLLLAGLGLFPILSAGSGSYAGFVQTTKRDFCGGCHVMEPWIKDAEDQTSTSLSAMHARNELFGDKSCYPCHADYGMFGTVATKVAGLHHVYGYLTKYWDTPLEEAVKTIKIFKPLPNSTCTHCHSTKLPGLSSRSTRRPQRRCDRWKRLHRRRLRPWCRGSCPRSPRRSDRPHPARQRRDHRRHWRAPDR